jgi:hypothetical protein
MILVIFIIIASLAIGIVIGIIFHVDGFSRVPPRPKPKFSPPPQPKKPKRHIKKLY